MDLEFIKYEKRNQIAYVTINRPEVLNALHPPAHLELEQVWDDFRDDPEMWVAIFTGSGEKAFCAGADLKYAAQHLSEPRRPTVRRHGFGGITNRFDLYKPIIAAVNGYAMGGGLETVLASDIVIAADHATFGQPEPRVGRAANFGGAVRMVRQLPTRQAMGLILTGKSISAQEAFGIGLVNEVVPLENLMKAAERWASEVLECSPLAIQAAKEAAMRSQDMPLSLALNTTFEYTVRLLNSKDPEEGARAFVEKRKPKWQSV